MTGTAGRPDRGGPVERIVTGDARLTLASSNERYDMIVLDAFSSGGVERADVDVDGQVYHPSVGESFGPNKQYRLQSVSGNCATFLYGDESFTLCVAQNK